MLKTDYDNCTGCAACERSCPVNAIQMCPDKYGFLYPKINEEMCIGCGKCDKVCHLLNDREYKHPNEFYALQLKEKTELMKVSSGGAFLAFANVVLDENGVVYGAAQPGITRVEHIRVTDRSSLPEILRSKYLQSDISKCFEKIKEDLDKKIIVLFCGTPCQTNALAAYLGGTRDNLILCDIVCHGVPSAMAFSKYCEELECKYKSKISSIIYRDKSFGWSNNHYCISFKDGQQIKEPSIYNPFHWAYLKGLLYRKSCETCRYAQLNRIADVVIADYWKYKGSFKNVDCGVSLVVEYTEKGHTLIDRSTLYAEIEKTEKDKAIESCRHLTQTPQKNIERQKYLDNIVDYDYFTAYNRFTRQISMTEKIKRLIRRVFVYRKENHNVCK